VTVATKVKHAQTTSDQESHVPSPQDVAGLVIVILPQQRQAEDTPLQLVPGQPANRLRQAVAATRGVPHRARPGLNAIAAPMRSSYAARSLHSAAQAKYHVPRSEAILHDYSLHHVSSNLKSTVNLT